MPVPSQFLFLPRIVETDLGSMSWSGRLSVRDAPVLAPFSGTDHASIIGLGSRSPGDPQAFMPPTSGVAANGLPIYNWDQAAAQIARQSSGWGPGAVVSFAFRSTAPGAMPDDTAGFVRFTEAQIAMTLEALALWSEVANITFVRVNDGDGYSNSATMLFSNYTSGAEGASAFAYYPGSTNASALAGDVWINFSLEDNNTNLVEGAFGPHTMAHEIGHAIGLAHPANYDALGGADPTYPESAVYWQDGRMFTVMSYFGSSALGGSLNAFSSGPQLHDIAAAQLLYGANTSTRTGDTVYGFNSNTGHARFTVTADGQSPVFAIWDGGGNDTLDLSGYSTPVEIDLRPEAFSSAGPGNGGTGVAVGNISIARGAIIENGIGGSGADTLIGNSVNNNLSGGAGADTITGGAGVDAISGGAGDDVINYNFGDGVDAAIDGGVGTDRIVTQGNAGGETLDVRWNGTSFTSFKGSTVVSVEQAVVDMGGGVDWLRHHNSTLAISINLAAGTATGFISIANIENAWGSAFNDTLTGSAVANIIRGGAGSDTIDGAAGNDLLVGDDGIDTISGGDNDDSIYGLSGADIINGGAGADTINYSFGEGVDAIDGGDGTDTIVSQGNSGAETLEVVWDGSSFTFFKGGAVSSIEQAIAEMGVGGDWLRYSGSTVAISIDLDANTASGFISVANVENAAGGSGGDTIAGSAIANNLVGNDGADTINGGAGNDTVNGGNGDDTLTGGADSDTLVGGAGSDTFVFATGSGPDNIADFDANATGGQDFLDITGYGITAGDFASRVTITDQGVNTLVTIDGVNTIILFGVTGDGNNVITQSDFIFGP